MENNAKMHKKAKFLIVFLLLTITTCYITANIYEKYVAYKESDELVFVISQKNMEFTEKSQEKSWYKDAFESVTDFFSPTKILVPVLVIFPEDSEINETLTGENSSDYKKYTGKNDKSAASDEISRDNPQNVDSVYRDNTKEIVVSGGRNKSPKIKWNFKTNDAAVTYGEKNTAKIDIFSNSNEIKKQKIIYPGISGNYSFTVDNTNNNYNIVYNITFEEEGLKTIPMVYRLSTENGYLGDKDKWYRVDELSKLINLAPMSKKEKNVYTLEWKWQEGENDNQYIQYAGKEYTLKITVYAEAR